MVQLMACDFKFCTTGIDLTDESAMRGVRVDIHDCDRYGIHMDKSSRTQLCESRVRKNHGCAVNLSQQSQFTMARCDIEYNDGTAISNDGMGSFVMLREVQMHHNRK